MDKQDSSAAAFVARLERITKVLGECPPMLELDFVGIESILGQVLCPLWEEQKRDCITTSCVANVCAEPDGDREELGLRRCHWDRPLPASSLQSKVQMLNVSSAALSLTGLEIRYDFTDEAAAVGRLSRPMTIQLVNLSEET